MKQKDILTICTRCGNKYYIQKDYKKFKSIDRERNQYVKIKCADCNLIHYYPEVYKKIIGKEDLSEFMPGQYESIFKRINRWMYGVLGEEKYEVAKEIMHKVVQGLAIGYIIWFLVNLVNII